MEFAIEISNKNGIHLRPATLLVKIALQYPDTLITLQKGEKAADANSIMSVLSLEATYQSKITFKLEGGNVDKCKAKIDALIAQNLI